MFGRAFFLSTFIVTVIFISTLNATSKCTLNGKEVPCHTLQELSSRQKRSVPQKPGCEELKCINGHCTGNCTIDITTPAAPVAPAAPDSPDSPAAPETTNTTTAIAPETTTTASDSIKNGYGICLMVASIFAYLFLH